ncbi:MAG: hypothetical protein HY717_14730 [Planctomycetes bacterium]|nr:hypothetical protein [Planctomycetota bacterium]
MPHESEGHQALAEVREGQGRWREAAGEWRRVREIRSREPAGYLGEARALLQLGESGQARLLLERVLKTDWPARFDEARERALELLKRIQ